MPYRLNCLVNEVHKKLMHRSLSSFLHFNPNITKSLLTLYYPWMNYLTFPLCLKTSVDRVTVPNSSHVMDSSVTSLTWPNVKGMSYYFPSAWG